MFHKISKILSKKRVSVFLLLQPILNMFIRKKALSLLLKRSDLSLTSDNSVLLAEDIPIGYYYASTPEIEKFNDFYGIATVLKKYAKLPNGHIIKAHVEHAISFSDSMFSGEMNCSYPKIILCGDHRKEILEKVGLKRKIYTVGPYICYAKSILNNIDFLSEKKRLGKNILIFPQHSTPGIDVTYDIKTFCKKLNEITSKYRYKTARVCLYWKDIELMKIYQEEGFEVVTAGHMFDPLFLPRLRSLIELSDLTITNSVGSHLGYSIALGKPHIFIKQNVQRTDRVNELYKDFDKKFDESIGSLTGAFEKYSESISKKQYDIVNYYAGFNHLKTPEELNQILRGVI